METFPALILTIFLIMREIRTETHTDINLKSLAVTLRITRFNIQKFYMVLALCCVFCKDIRTDSDFCFIHP